MTTKTAINNFRKKHPEAYKQMYARVYSRGYSAGKKSMIPNHNYSIDEKGRIWKIIPGFLRINSA